MSTIAKNKKSEVSRVQQLVAGTHKHFPNGSQELTVGGVTQTVSALTQLLQSYVDVRSAVLASQADAKTKLATERAQAPNLLAVANAYEAYVRATFGKQPDVLADFGLAPPKTRKPPTAEQKAASAAKRAATRAARHTMGKTKKKAVKGNVTAKLVVEPGPGAAAESPAASAAPAPPAQGSPASPPAAVGATSAGAPPHAT